MTSIGFVDVGKLWSQPFVLLPDLHEALPTLPLQRHTANSLYCSDQVNFIGIPMAEDLEICRYTLP